MEAVEEDDTNDDSLKENQKKVVVKKELDSDYEFQLEDEDDEKVESSDSEDFIEKAEKFLDKKINRRTNKVSRKS